VKTLIFCNLRQKYVLSLILFCFALFLKSNLVFAQTSIETNQQPLHIVSDEMVAQQSSSMVEFSGNVKAVLNDSTVFADSIKIYFNADNNKDDKDTDDKNKKKTDEQNSIKKIISTGDVKYSAGERKAFADKAVYTTIDDKLILTGKSPKLITGSSFVTGKKITFYRTHDKVIVESDNKKRVEAFFNPEENIIQDTGTKNIVQGKQ